MTEPQEETPPTSASDAVDTAAEIARIRRTVDAKLASRSYPPSVYAAMAASPPPIRTLSPPEEFAAIETVLPSIRRTTAKGRLASLAAVVIGKAVGWYLRPILHQQTLYNVSLIREVHDLDARLRLLESDLASPGDADDQQQHAELAGHLEGLSPGSVVLLLTSDPAARDVLEQRGLIAREDAVDDGSHPFVLHDHVDRESAAAIVTPPLLSCTAREIDLLLSESSRALHPDGRLICALGSPSPSSRWHDADALSDYLRNRAVDAGFSFQRPEGTSGGAGSFAVLTRPRT